MMNRISLFFGFVVLFSCTDSNDFRPIEENRLMETVQYNSIQGVEDDLLSLDIYYTDDLSAEKPVILWVHGGAWCVGDKSNKITDKVELFQSNNWIFVSVNYRLSPFPYELDNIDRIKYPIHNIDVADAIRWVHGNISNYGGDANRMVLLGHSAGAHLVSLTGTRRSFVEDLGVPFSIIKGVASIDTRAYDVQAVIEEENEAYINAFGCNIERNIQASPLYNVVEHGFTPKFFIAKRGNRQRLGIAEDFISALENAQFSVDHVDGSQYTHSGINDAIGQEDEMVITPPLLDFIRDCFGE